jgi:hypothetical protein
MLALGHQLHGPAQPLLGLDHLLAGEALLPKRIVAQLDQFGEPFTAAITALNWSSPSLWR